ncbi:MAG: hypothetical protein K2Z81_00935, partial [Cyanobacteria bacterium]|nr:hypothetical protein [Cyanobacteriota bacterium]
MSQKLSLQHEYTSAADALPAPQPSSKFTSWLSNCVVAMILAACSYLSFGKVLNAYFVANDESWHMPLLYKAFAGDWSLLYGQFAAPFMFNKSLLLMYRPMTELSLALDYAIWGANPFGYYLSSLLIHIASAFLVYIASRQLLDFLLIRRELAYEISQGSMVLIAFSAALLFAVFPLSAEVLCWISDRNDGLGALFLLSSIVSYLHYMRCDISRWRYLSLLACALGLLTKEACASIPLVILALDYAFAGSERQDGQGRVRRIKGSLTRVWPFFALFTVYFICRWNALGDIYGGYIGSIGHLVRRSMVTRVLAPEHVWRLFHPLNLHIFGPNHLLDAVIRFTYSLAAMMIVVGGLLLPCTRDRLRAALFLFFIAFLIFAPALNTWYINDGLFGARHAYLALFPSILGIVLFALPISKTGHFQRVPEVLRTIGVCSLACTVAAYIFIAQGNTWAWTQVAEEARLVRKETESQVSTLPRDKKLVVFNLPISIAGINTFFSTEFLPGLLKRPLTRTDISDRVVCLDGAPVNRGYINFSQLQSLLGQPDKYRIVAWSKMLKRFDPVTRESIGSTQGVASDKLPVVPLGSFKQLDDCLIDKSSLFSNRTPGSDIESYLLPSGKIKPADAKIVEITIRCTRIRDAQAVDGAIGRLAELRDKQLEADDIYAHGSMGMLSWSGRGTNADGSVRFRLTDDGAAHTYTVELTQFKSWLVSGGVEAFRLDLPRRDLRYPYTGAADFRYEVLAASVNNYAERSPSLTFTGDAQLTSIGLLKPGSALLSFDYDATSIKNAAAVVVEISKPYCEFDLYNNHYRDKKLCRYAMKQLRLPHTRG